MPGINKFIDLHLHLDGAITADIARRLADISSVTLPEDDNELEKQIHVSEDCTSLTEFLEKFALPGSLMQTYESLSEAVYLVCESLKKQGLIYAEIRFAPQLHTNGNMEQEDAILAALDGLKRSSMKANLILCMMRGEGNEAQNAVTLELTKKYLVDDGGVVALDLAGAEALFPTDWYKEDFEKAKAYNIPFTIHAGEAAGPESVRLAIEYGAKRIGHGIRAKEDAAVLQVVKESGVTLDMCPTSEKQTHAIEDMSQFPFIEYMNQGIKVTLNTDDPAIENTTIAGEYDYMEKEFGLTLEQEIKSLEYAIDAAFTTDEVKQQLKESIRQ